MNKREAPWMPQVLRNSTYVSRVVFKLSETLTKEAYTFIGVYFTAEALLDHFGDRSLHDCGTVMKSRIPCEVSFETDRGLKQMEGVPPMNT